MRSFLIAGSIALAASSCTRSSALGDLDLDRAGASSALQRLAARARSGNQQAQLELGIAFEKGQGVARNCQRAAALYRAAAMSRGGRTAVYAPPAGRGSAGSVIPVDRGPLVAGLDDAKRRLAHLQVTCRPLNGLKNSE